ncbi:outer membrane protein assembly factor BamE [Tepidicella baoligensis]|uniref:outer membrane protein assembly factor BamE n=1 Tax=Tepidicella baoligensis TaxID=2707016 RepID=UPI0015DABD1D|nr:outer membrane protein assembly factor BamE [Tepidicella baoligensis]
MSTPFSNRLRLAGAGALAAAALTLPGCASLNDASTSLSTLGGLITPYRIDIVQGNVVVREQVEALQPGMSREQVRNILGTPLVASAFHADRWDYVFTFRRQGQEPQQRRVSVFFEGPLLQRVEADELPTEEEFVASLDTRRRMGRAPALEATEEQLRAFHERYNTGAATAAARPAPPAPSTASYPPLEPR